MADRTFTISTQRDEGFMLNVRDYGARRFLWPVSELIHWVTFKRFFYTVWAQRFMSWIDDDRTEVVRIPLTYEQVNAIAPGEWDWSMNADRPVVSPREGTQTDE